VTTIEELTEQNTKEELRERAHDHGVSVPRGADKQDVAELVALEENTTVVKSGRELEHAAEQGGFVRFDGEWLQLKPANECAASADGLLFKAGGSGFVVSRGFGGNTMDIASPGSLVVSRCQ
jgi:hypothetical protein